MTSCTLVECRYGYYRVCRYAYGCIACWRLFRFPCVHLCAKEGYGWRVCWEIAGLSFFQAFVCTDGTPEEKEELAREVSRLSSNASAVVFFSSTFLPSLLSSSSLRALCSDKNTPHNETSDRSQVREPNRKICSLFLAADKNLTDDISRLLLHPGIAALVETWIASLSSYFIGTENSRFSQAIRWERIFNGFPHATTLETFCLHKEPIDSDRSSTMGEASQERNQEEKDEKKKCFAVKSHDPPEFASRSEIRKMFWP